MGSGKSNSINSSSSSGSGSRYGYHYAAVAVSGAGGSPREDRKSGFLARNRRRAVGAVGVFLALGLAASKLQQQHQQQSTPYGRTYRGMLQQVRQEASGRPKEYPQKPVEE